MRRRAVQAALLCSIVAVASGCETAKSSNPTSPSVAGPIAGVSITPPKPLEPGASWTIANNAQPITLLIENSSTNGQRAVTYIFEIATDSEFSTKVFSRDGIPPGDGGRTALRLPDALSGDRTYFWRAKATDGANASSYSAAVPFTVFIPASLGIPTPLSPVGDTRISGRRPEFVVRNSTRSGPIGAVSYGFEISENDAFTAMVAVVTVPEASNETRFTLGQDLKYDTRYFWRVRSFESNTGTGWSPTQAFTTAVLPPITPPVPLAPIGGVQTSNLSPEFVARNATFGASVGPIAYQFDLAENSSFTAMVAVLTVPQGAGDTRFTLAQGLKSSTQYFWRVRAADSQRASAWSATQNFVTPTPAPTPVPPPITPPPSSGWPKTGPEVVAYAERNYPDRLRAGVSLSERQANMEFLRDRMIEAGICGGLDLAWNLKRGGPERSIDYLDVQRNGRWIGVDIGMDYDNTSVPLRIYWGEGSTDYIYPQAYSPRPTCR
jgi:hypothetical protein